MPEFEKYEKKLRQVFDAAPPNSAQSSRAILLFEDLRIEEYGSRLDTLADLDVIKGYRKIYFLRRSIATLVEFAGAIEMLDQRPEFREIKKRFDRDVQARWDSAAMYFRDSKEYLSARRADFGGHFDHGSARHACSEDFRTTSRPLGLRVVERKQVTTRTASHGAGLQNFSVCVIAADQAETQPAAMAPLRTS